MAGRKKFLLRLPPELLDALKAWAEQELRSVNSQVEFILREAVKKRLGSDKVDQWGGDDDPGGKRLIEPGQL